MRREDYDEWVRATARQLRPAFKIRDRDNAAEEGMRFWDEAEAQIAKLFADAFPGETAPTAEGIHWDVAMAFMTIPSSSSTTAPTEGGSK